MVGKLKKKYEAGEATYYMSRAQALKRLQLTLRDFRRICILKGIYPREPRKRKRAQKGATDIKTLYYKKDIQFLMHEPIIWKIREQKVFFRKRGKAKALKDKEGLKQLYENKPRYTLDHLVKERYPTFVDAIRDMDDCLTLCFLFSTFPQMKSTPRGMAFLCRRLTIEFLHYVIEAKALRKVFVSIKGFYYQAEIKGQTVTWIVPHHFSFVPETQTEVDFRVMTTFVDFYTTMLGFVNFRLYHSLNVYYPPQLPGYAAEDQEKELVDEEEYVYERIAALNLPLPKSVIAVEEEEDPEIDEFSIGTEQQNMEDAKKEMESLKNLKKLFVGLKIFVNREVPREPLVFAVRAFGGEVSWDKLLFPGSTFVETDESITHQIVDRPSMERQYLSRYYVQPQWVFDSVNARQLLPPEDYFIGAVLPPHLSPFVQDKPWMYVPPEEEALKNIQKGVKPEPSNKAESSSEDDDEEDEAEEEEEEKSEKDEESASGSEEEEEEAAIVEEESEEIKREKKLKEMKENMRVKAGSVETPDVSLNKFREEREQLKLREKMMRKKHKKIYRRMMDKRQQWSKEKWLLKKKRTRIDEETKKEKKIKKKLAATDQNITVESIATPHEKRKVSKKNEKMTEKK